MKHITKLILLSLSLCLLTLGSYITTFAQPYNSTTTVCNEVIRLVNIERAKYGIRHLSTNAAMMRVAAIRATEQRRYFSHTRPDGRSYESAFLEGGIYDVKSSYRGENIAQGQRSADEVVRDWMNSSGHRRNILDSNFDSIGVGYEPTTNSWVQVFMGHYRR